jgi:hypothetical protein
MEFLFDEFVGLGRAARGFVITLALMRALPRTTGAAEAGDKRGQSGAVIENADQDWIKLPKAADKSSPGPGQ